MQSPVTIGLNDKLARFDALQNDIDYDLTETLIRNSRGRQMSGKTRTTALATLLALIVTFSTQASEMTVVSWGGAHTHALERVFYRPFNTKTGIAVRSLHYDGHLGQIRERVESNSVLWDVVDLGSDAMHRACAEGLLETLPTDELPGHDPQSLNAGDFLAGSVSPCAVAYAAWSVVLAFPESEGGVGAPADGLERLFNPELWPGKRSLIASPRGLLEWALISEGVSPQYVYEHLQTREGQARAFGVLERIRADTEWRSTTGDRLEDILGDGVSVAMAYSTDVFDARVRRNQAFQVVWGSHLFSLKYFGIPRGSNTSVL